MHSSYNNHTNPYNNGHGPSGGRARGYNLSITEGISSLSKYNAKLERMLAKIGTKADNGDFRDRMHRDQLEATQLVKGIMNDLKQASTDANTDKSMLQRLSTNFKREFQTYQRIQDQLDARQIAVINRVQQERRSRGNSFSANQHAYTGEFDAASQNHGQIYNQQLLSDEEYQFSEYNAEEIERRTGEIKKIEQSVGEVAEMFKDLQLLVNQQQEHIDIIDNNITQTRDQVEAGHKQLEQAEEYQSKARKRKCCLLVIFLSVIGAIVGIVLIAK